MEKEEYISIKPINDTGGQRGTTKIIQTQAGREQIHHDWLTVWRNRKN